MYIAKKRSRGYTYYQVLESRREGGVVKKRVVTTLGSIERLLSLSKSAINEETVHLANVSNFEYGASFALNRVCDELQLEVHIDKSITKPAEVTSIGKVMKLASIHRCIRPLGFNDVSTWLDGSVLKHLENVSPSTLVKQNLNNWLDNFDEETVDQIQTNIFTTIIEKFDPDLSRIIIDFTNVDTYQKLKIEEQLAKRGRPKSGKKSVLQINYALVCSNDGIPLHHAIYGGNVNDPTYFKTFSGNLLKKYGEIFKQKDILVFVFDNGMNSKEAILNIHKDYKFVASLKSSECKDIDCDVNNYKLVGKDKDGNEVRCHEFNISKYGEDFRGMASYHEKTAKLIERQYSDKIKKVKKELKQMKQKLNKKKWRQKEVVEKRIKKLLTKYKFTTLFDVKLVVRDSKLYFEKCDFNKDEFEKVKQSWGISFLFTNLKETPAKEILDVYFKEKNTIEDCNKMLKNVDFCRVGPVRCYINEHIRAHFLICTIALTAGRLLARGVNKKLKRNWTPATILDGLQKLNIVKASIMPYNKVDTVLSNYELGSSNKELFDCLRLKQEFKRIKSKIK